MSLRLKDYEDYLKYLRDFFEAGWDKKDEHFDLSIAVYETKGNSIVDWYPQIIEELNELLDSDVVYVDENK